MGKRYLPAKAGIQEEAVNKSDQYFVYILASKKNGTLYIGVTNNPEWMDLFDQLTASCGYA